MDGLCARISHLPANTSRTLALNFHVPDDTAAGNISTVIVTVGGPSATDVENRAVFYVYVKPDVSHAAPAASIHFFLGGAKFYLDAN